MIKEGPSADLLRTVAQLMQKVDYQVSKSAASETEIEKLTATLNEVCIQQDNLASKFKELYCIVIGLLPENRRDKMVE